MYDIEVRTGYKNHLGTVAYVTANIRAKYLMVVLHKLDGSTEIITKPEFLIKGRKPRIAT
jgi:hypothetical protein